MPQAFTVTASDSTIPDRWWTLFHDATLDSLVDEALVNNQDLAAAAARVEQSRAIAGVAKAALYPEITVGGNGSRTQLPENTAVSRDNPVNFFSLLGNISYELDFWASSAMRTRRHATRCSRRKRAVAMSSSR